MKDIRKLLVDNMVRYLIEWAKADRVQPSEFRAMAHQENLAAEVHTFVNRMEDIGADKGDG